MSEDEAPRPRPRVLVIGGNRIGFASAVARRMAAAGGMKVVVLPEGTRIDPPDPARFFDDWPVPTAEIEAPRDRADRISGLQIGRKHIKKKGKR